MGGLRRRLPPLHRPKPVATYRSPAAMFADTIIRPVSGLTSAFGQCRRIAFPRPWDAVAIGFAVHSFTVAGAAPGLVLEEHAPASRFTRRRSRSVPRGQQ